MLTETFGFFYANREEVKAMVRCPEPSELVTFIGMKPLTVTLLAPQNI